MTQWEDAVPKIRVVRGRGGGGGGVLQVLFAFRFRSSVILFSFHDVHS